MAQKIWNVELNGRLLDMYRSGTVATSEMADRLGVSIPTVYHRLHDMSLSTSCLPRRYRAAKKVALTKEEERTIVRLSEDGLKITQILPELNRLHGLEYT